MPKNLFIYIGVLVVAACALLYIAFQFTKFVQPILPYAAAVGALLLVIGIVVELKKTKSAVALASGLKPGENSAESIKDTGL